jgi:hypothetical protein
MKMAGRNLQLKLGFNMVRDLHSSQELITLSVVMDGKDINKNL